MTASATKTNGKVATHEEELLKLHSELVALYAVRTGAARAQVSKRLNLVQMELDLAGVEGWTYWEKPSPVVIRSYVHTEEELLARIEGLRKQVARTDRPEVARATADRELTNALEQASKRGITVPSA